MARTARTWLRAALVVAGLTALAAAWVGFRDVPTLAPEVVPTDAAGSADAAGPRLRGVYHVHSDSSHDGRLPAAELMAAADRLDLDFVVFAEHNARPRHAPSPDGALAVPGTELSTRYGHLVYLGYPEVPEPGPLRHGIGLVDSLGALGAFTVLAHPASPRRPWVGRRTGAGGLEIASTSSSARVKGDPITGLLAPLFALPVNPRLALAQLYRRNDEALEIWDAAGDASMAGLCSVDAHGWIPAELNFRSWQLVLDPRAEGVGAPTEGEVVERIAAGGFACLAALLAPTAGPPPRFSFVAEHPAGRVAQGGSVPRGPATVLRVEAPGLSGGGTVSTVLLRDGEEVARTLEPELRLPDPPPGAYRVEVRIDVPGVFAGTRRLPVIYSNRIRVTE
ncbi:MAG: PHP domain-containing protein [Gemmatimonadota bacterium]